MHTFSYKWSSKMHAMAPGRSIRGLREPCPYEVCISNLKINYETKDDNIHKKQSNILKTNINTLKVYELKG